MRTIQVFILAAALIGIAGCGKGGQDPQVEACVERGIAYFKEVGSYPLLQSAPTLRAEDVARERCNRTTTAFN